MPRQPEGKLVKKIADAIKARGGRSFKIQAAEGSFQEVGIPDLLWAYHGRFVGSEVKQPGESLRPAQRVVLHEIFVAGGVAAVLETVEQAESLMSVLDQESPREKTRGICFDRGRLSRRVRFR